MNRMFTSWWFGEVVILSLCGGVLLVAMLLTPSEAAVSLFGIEIPMTCGFRRMTGLECLGCGLTRSFAFMGSLRPVEAFQMHWAGPVLFALLATQPPYRVYTLARGWLRRRPGRG